MRRAGIRPPANRVNVQLRLAARTAPSTLVSARRSIRPAAVVGVSPGETGIFRRRRQHGDASGRSGRQRGDRRAFLDHPGSRFRRPDAEVLRDPRRRFRSARHLHEHGRRSRARFAFEFTVANEVSGIGLDIFDSSRDFGSGGRLRSVVDMDPGRLSRRIRGSAFSARTARSACSARSAATAGSRSSSSGRRGELEGVAGARRGALELLLRFRRLAHGGQRHRGHGQRRVPDRGAVSRYSALDQYAMGLVDASASATVLLRGESGDDAPEGSDVGAAGRRDDHRHAAYAADSGHHRDPWPAPPLRSRLASACTGRPSSSWSAWARPPALPISPRSIGSGWPGRASSFGPPTDACAPETRLQPPS